jgi:hypothetical protein
MTKLGTALASSHSLRPRIGIGDEGVDAVLVDTFPQRDYLFEIKYFGNAPAEDLTRDAIKEMAEAVANYSRLVSRETTGLLLIILGQESHGRSDADARQMQVSQLVRGELERVRQ